MQRVWRIVWKTFAVAAALIVSAIGASQAAWSGADLFLNKSLMGMVEEQVTWLYTIIGIGVTFGALYLVEKIAKPALFLLIPVCLYTGGVLGVWNGLGSDFDATRLQAIKHGYANAYALEHMSARARYISCGDKRIELSDDAKPVCEQALHGSAGEPMIAGSEHKCGPLGMMTCFYSPRDKR